MNTILRKLLIPQPKSKIKAGEGLETGDYKFFTSSSVQCKFFNDFQYDEEALIFGTGGNASVHYCNEPFSTSTDCIVVYGNEGVNLKMVYYYLSGQIYLLQNGFKGAGLQHISKDYILNIPIDLPNRETQNEIVKIFDKLEKVITILNVKLMLFDKIVQSRFVEMFGDPTDNPMGWDKFPLGKRCNIITGNTPPRADAENYGTFIEWIKSDNINTPDTYLTTAEEYLSEKGFEKCRYVEAGSVLMTCIAGSIGCIGNVAVADRRVAFNQQINAIIPVDDETLYVFWLMQLSRPYIQSTINMALKGILSKGQLSILEFPFPPVPKQLDFAAFVYQVDKSKLAVQKGLEKLEILKKSLMQQYFGQEGTEKWRK